MANNFGDGLASCMGMIIENNDNRFKSISSCGCNVGDVGMKGLSDGLAQDRSIEQMYLANDSRMGHEGTWAFGFDAKSQCKFKGSYD